MIMQWKKEGADYVTIWQNMHFLLTQNAPKNSSSRSNRWHLYTDGKHVKGDWPSARAAMNHVDNKQQQVIRRVVTSNQQRLGKAVGVAQAAIA